MLAVDAKSPSTLLAHKAGYIERDNEIIVGLQADEPFKRVALYGARSLARRPGSSFPRPAATSARPLADILSTTSVPSLSARCSGSAPKLEFARLGLPGAAEAKAARAAPVRESRGRGRWSRSCA